MSRPRSLAGTASDLPVLGQPAEAPATGSAWPTTLLVLGLALLGFGVLFAEEGAAAVRVWNSSETYNHCWLILPIAAWLAWGRRQRLEGMQPQPTPLFALLAVPAGIAWLVAERLGIMEGRQLTALALFYVLMLTVLGWRICRAMAAPLLYLVFLVPFGAFTVPVLQRITAWMIDIGLDVMQIAHYVDELIIETPSGTYLVAEACAGLRFLIAAVAFGALYAIVMFRSPGRRLIVLGLALVVPIVANGIRAFGIVLLGDYLGSAEAAAADHIIYGWVFFSIVILLLIVAGLPFREDGAPAPRPPAPATPDTAPRGIALATAALAAMALTATGPAVAFSLQQSAGRAPERVPVQLAAIEGCGVVLGGTALQCGPLTLTAEAVVFPSQATWSLVSAERWRLASGSDTDIQFTARGAGVVWQARQSREAATTVAVATWLNGRQVSSGLRGRAEQGLNSIAGGRGVPVLMAITIRPEAGTTLNGPRQRALIEALVEAQGQAIAARAAALSAAQRQAADAPMTGEPNRRPG